MREDETDRPIQFIEGQGKLRNGLFLRRVALYDDRIALEVFASRALHVEEIANLCLTDDIGTKYVMASTEAGLIEGKAQIEFRPAAPTRWSQLHLSQPGWGLHIIANVPE